MKKILLAVLFLLCANLLSAEEERLPDYAGYVNDFANTLSPQTESMLTAMARQI